MSFARHAIAAATLLLVGAHALAYHGAGPGPSTPRPRTGPAISATVPLVAPSAVLKQLEEEDIPPSSLGFMARQVDSRRPFAAHNAEQPFVLASTAKLVTSMAALELLGPQHQWRTQAFAKGAIAGGRLAGDLLIVGGGNPLLTAQALRRWFRELREHGLDEIDGDIILDRSLFSLQPDDQARVPQPEPDRPHHAVPDALVLNEGLLQVEVAPAASGRPAIRLEPPLAGVMVHNAVAGKGGCSAHASASPINGPLRPDDPLPPIRLSVRGAAATDCGVQRVQFAPLPHAELALRAVAALWSEVGGRLQGRVIDRSGDASPALQRDADGRYELAFASHGSELLPQVVREVNKASNNLVARHLMLSLAPGFPLRPATLDAARERVRRWLRGKGLAEGDIEVDSGSGLSRAERGKPRALVDLLVRSWHSPTAAWLVDSLPVAGVDGTLAGRMRDGPAAGRAQLKTGTLRDTRALAGYVRARSGKVYAFSAVVNHPEAARSAPALDALVEWLVENG